MRLATYLPPGASEPVAGEVRGDEVVAFAEGTVLDRLASGDRTPADGEAHPLADVTAAEACTSTIRTVTTSKS